ncbi:MAG TPA: NUDIX hydrolase [Caulobacteraceae bacterium]|jgi:8-oxo-dGTP pyrophosphatase MutT (NUDIX family)|nr:NUDIX hydrolase [Caulobacteraceae bacterium]
MKRPLAAGKQAARAGRPAVQYAALPYRQAGEVEILLVTSRETRRWVIPKGWPMKGKKPHAAAAREALEEAGVTGRIGRSALGAYPYVKWLGNGAPAPCRVRVFPLEVMRERNVWPEMGQRERRWFSVPDAAAAVDEPELAELILTFDPVAAR